jgi:hypothetical protein
LCVRCIFCCASAVCSNRPEPVFHFHRTLVFLSLCVSCVSRCSDRRHS